MYEIRTIQLYDKAKNVLDAYHMPCPILRRHRHTTMGSYIAYDVHGRWPDGAESKAS